MSRVIVFGSINIDYVTNVTSHPKSGETILGENLKYFPGGKGANQAVSASRLGANTIMIGNVGNDSSADFMCDFLTSQEINISNVTKDNIATGTAFIAIDKSGENTIIVIPAANGKITNKQINNFIFEDGDILVCQNEIPPEAILTAFKKAKEKNVTIIYNPAPAIDVPNDLFELSDYIIVNETEYIFYKQLISSKSQTIIKTLGKNGVKVTSSKEEYHIEGNKVDVVDTTGAGDCFTGALATRLSFKDKLKDAIIYANKAASIATTVSGAGTSMPTQKEMSQQNK